jgi:hypothetical protein
MKGHNVIHIIGDLHGKLNKINISKYKEDDILLQLGDAGIVWTQDNFENFELDMFEKNFKGLLICILGNHENHNSIKHNYQTIRIFDAECYKIRKNIYFIKNGEVLNIDNKSFLILGGAFSIDKNNRIENMTWWSDEQMNYDEQHKALKKIEENNNKFNYVLSHTITSDIIDKYFDNLPGCIDSTSKFLSHINYMIKFEKWFFGHFHVDKVFEEKYQCVYEEVITL